MNFQNPGTLVQSPYLVAYLDFLGANDKMLSPEQSLDLLQKINLIYRTTLAQLDIAKKIWRPDLETRIFSDNILIACKIRNVENPISEFGDIQAFCRLFQAYAFSQGELVRGAITKGNFFINETFVYGEALCKAYYMESQIAKFPRVMIDPAIFSQGNISAVFFNPEQSKESVVKRDLAGTYFLNIFDFMVKHFSADEFNSLIKVVKEIIVKGYSDSLGSDIKKLEKYTWLATEFNSFCDENNMKEQKVLTPEFWDEVKHE